MSDKIVRMPPPVQLTDEDLEIAETACRDNAARCRRHGAIEETGRWERTADNIARRRTTRKCGQWSYSRAGPNTAVGERPIFVNN